MYAGSRYQVQVLWCLTTPQAIGKSVATVVVPARQPVLDCVITSVEYPADLSHAILLRAEQNRVRSRSRRMGRIMLPRLLKPSTILFPELNKTSGTPPHDQFLSKEIGTQAVLHCLRIDESLNQKQESQRASLASNVRKDF
jgi:hypothetical protein